MRCDILALEIYSSGRDIDITEPILSYLEIKYNLKVIRDSIFNFEYKLIKYRPKLLIVSNSVGSEYKIKAIKLATFLGIKTVTLVSEGGISFYYNELNDNSMENDFWGLNIEKFMYEDLCLQWNLNDYEIARKYLPQNKIAISGAVLFDKYQILSPMSAIQLKKKYDKEKYDKTILIAGWGFSALSGKYWEKNKDVLIKRLGGLEYINMHRNSAKLLHQIYEQIIQENTDILFIIKEHPSEKDYDNYLNTEYHGLEEYENVIFIKAYQENMMDLLSAADLLLAYDSTSELESWLMKKISIVVNPITENFSRLPFYNGSLIAKNSRSLNQYIYEYYKKNTIDDFTKKEEYRQALIKKFIFSGDGKNFLRASKCIIDLFYSTSNNKKVNYWAIKMIARGIIKNFINYKSPMDIFDYQEREKIRKKYYRGLKKFLK